MLIEKIKEDQITARKNRNTDAATSLTTLLGEASIVGKNDGNRDSTDDEVRAVVTKFIKGNKELMELTKPTSNTYVIAQAENELLSAYLPQQMTEQELRVAIETIVRTNNLSTPKDMGVVMGGLKKSFAGLYDGKQASQITREFLS